MADGCRSSMIAQESWLRQRLAESNLMGFEFPYTNKSQI
jgi:hypothetical protein